MIELFTIGFTKKSAEQFFNLLQTNQVQKIIDTRVSATSQLAGFAKQKDLQFFAKAICGMDYLHEKDFAPALERMRQYRKKEMTWEEYAEDYLNLLDLRKIAHKTNIDLLHQNCLLCSEHLPDFCHRRLLAEYLQAKFNGVEIQHLM